MKRAHLSVLALLAMAAAACGDDSSGNADAAVTADAAPSDATPSDAGPDPTLPLYDPDVILGVDITLDPADWETLRHQTRSIEDIFGGQDCLAQPFGTPFTYFPGTVTVTTAQGMTTLGMVGVRKKGFLGSLSVDKPSLKVDFNQYVAGQSLDGSKGLTLNNSQQDPSYLRQCLGYAVFTAAGIPAPRCNFAHVTVNGVDLGLYVHIEAVNKDFLQRHYADATGNLYEGTLSDFDPGWDGTFQKETNEVAADYSDIAAATTALGASDGQLVASLDPVVNLDDFLTFWAAESILVHWDGYAGNQNNFYVYADPGDGGRFHFIPWGDDEVLQLSNADHTPTSVVAIGLLARRLYLNPPTQAMYVARVQELLASAWSEATLLAEIERMRTLIAQVPDPGGNAARTAAINELRQVVIGRKQAILDELALGAPAWTVAARAPVCFKPVGTVSGSFDTTWASIGGDNPWAAPTTFTLVYMGNTVPFNMVGSAAGVNESGSGEIQVLGQLANGNILVAVFDFDPAILAPGSFAIDWTQMTSAVYQFDVATMQVSLVGYVDMGTVTVTAGSATNGAAVKGTFSATLETL
jgi:hypothetical protein